MSRSTVWGVRNRYTVYGIAFGTLFPVASFLILEFISQEVWFLFAIICTAPVFLGILARTVGARREEVDNANLELEARVEERTRSIQTLIDVSGQGFLSFDETFVVGPEYSLACRKIFADTLEGRKIDELLFSSERERAPFRSGLRLFFRGTAEPDVIFDLLEPAVVLHGRTFHLNYKAIGLTRVMLILTDVTRDLQQAEQAAREEKRQAMLLRVAANRSVFGHLVHEAEDLFPRLEQAHRRPELALRDLHTFKANAGFLGFDVTKQAAHDLEQYLQDCAVLGSPIDVTVPLAALRQAYSVENELVLSALGDGWVRDRDVVEVPLQEFLALETAVENRHPEDDALLGAMRRQRKVKLVSLFERFPFMVQDLASRLGKRIRPYEILADETRCDPQMFRPLVSVFAHVLRNQVDHGIEMAREREEAHKDPAGRLSLTISSTRNDVSFALADDGRGIDLAKVEAQARKQGLLAPEARPTQAELLTFLFHDRFTTQDGVSETSGRGVGLAAVRHAVRLLGGRISVRTSPGKGTTFLVTVPWNQAPLSQNKK